MGTVVSWLLARTGRTLGLILVLSLLTGMGASEAFRLVMETGHQDDFLAAAQRETALFQGRTLGGRAMGAVAISGLTQPSLRAVAASPDPTGPRYLAEAEHILEILGQEIEGEGTFVVNRAGVIVASWDDHGRARIGTDISFRPYVHQALSGMESVYAAVGTSTGDRALYLAAPIWGTEGDSKIVLGAVVARIGIAVIDHALRDWNGIAFLLSPQGVVFASSRRDWHLSIAGEITPDRIRALSASRQFGGAFDGPHRIRTLPFDPNATNTNINQTDYMVTRRPLQWNDPGGDWSLVLLTDLETATPLLLRMAIGLLSALGAGGLGLLGLGAHDRTIRLRQQESARAETVRLFADQTEKWHRQADLIARLQRTTTVAEIAQELFAGLARDLPLHQGSLYVIDVDGQSLCLAGLYGGGSAPERIGLEDGMIGECARMCRALCFEDPPAGVWRIRREQGEASPRALLLLPLVRADRVLGVLELASLSPTLATDRTLIEAVLPALAVQIDLVLAIRQAQDYLVEGRRLTEAVRLQQDFSQQTEDWFRTIIDELPVGLLVVDPSGRITLSNREIERMSGYSLDELLGAEIETLLPARVRPHHVECRKSLALCAEQVILMASGSPELPLLTRDGTERLVEISLAQTPALGSQPPCTCAMIRPVVRTRS